MEAWKEAVRDKLTEMGHRVADFAQDTRPCKCGKPAAVFCFGWTGQLTLFECEAGHWGYNRFEMERMSE